MRRMLFGLPLLLIGCSNMVGSPFVGFGGFVADTHTIARGPHQPDIDSVNYQRVIGGNPATEPLLPEPGNVWPGPPPPEPTLEDIQKMQNSELPDLPLPLPQISPSPAPGSSTPPGSVQPGAAPQSFAPPPRLPPPANPVQQTTVGVVQTQTGPAVISAAPNGVQTFTMPDGTTGRAVPNANGTVTLISPNGNVQSVPGPR